MKNVKSRWWLVLIPLLLVAAALMISFWDTVIMFIAPKTVLSTAITDTIAKLETRFADCPLWTIAAGYDELGQNTVHMKLNTVNTRIGQIGYDMILQTDAENHQVLADGTVTTQNKTLDVSAYLNTDFVAITSNDLLQGGYYGITYDTFSADIRSFPLVSLLIPNATIMEWEASLQKVQSFMNRSYDLPQIPDVTEEDMKMLILGILALKSDVVTEKIVWGGETLSCYKITYSETGDQIGELLQHILDVGNQDQKEIKASFYLYEEALVKVELTGTAGLNTICCDVTLGLDPAVDDLSLLITKKENGIEKSSSVAVSTSREGERYIETIAVDNVAVTYDWHPASGDMMLYFPEREPISLILTSTEQGFQIKTMDLMKLLDLESEAIYDCEMEITKGSGISEPSYKNMDQWSFDDLMVLLSGIGSMLGLYIR